MSQRVRVVAGSQPKGVADLVRQLKAILTLLEYGPEQGEYGLREYDPTPDSDQKLCEKVAPLLEPMGIELTIGRTKKGFRRPMFYVADEAKAVATLSQAVPASLIAPQEVVVGAFARQVARDLTGHSLQANAGSVVDWTQHSPELCRVLFAWGNDLQSTRRLLQEARTADTGAQSYLRIGHALGLTLSDSKPDAQDNAMRYRCDSVHFPQWHEVVSLLRAMQMDLHNSRLHREFHTQALMHFVNAIALPDSETPSEVGTLLTKRSQLRLSEHVPMIRKHLIRAGTSESQHSVPLPAR